MDFHSMDQMVKSRDWRDVGGEKNSHFLMLETNSNANSKSVNA